MKTFEMTNKGTTWNIGVCELSFIKIYNIFKLLWSIVHLVNLQWLLNPQEKFSDI